MGACYTCKGAYVMVAGKEGTGHGHLSLATIILWHLHSFAVQPYSCAYIHRILCLYTPHRLGLQDLQERNLRKLGAILLAKPLSAPAAERLARSLKPAYAGAVTALKQAHAALAAARLSATASQDRGCVRGICLI